MKKTALLIAFMTVGFLGLAQTHRPYVVRYASQGDTIRHNVQAVSGIHIDTLGHEMTHEGGTEWSALADMDTVYVYRGDETVNPAYVPIDWESTTLVQADDSLGNYQMQFGGAVPEDLVPGSVIAIDYDTAVRYVYVETVSVNRNTVTLSSTEANLTDIFADVEFTLATNPNRRAAAKGQVFYPVAAYQRDGQGGYSPMNLSQRDLRWGFTHNLWNYGQNLDGEVLFSGNNFSVYMEHMNFDLDLDLELYMNFGGRDVLEIVGDALEVYRSRALNVNAALLGTFSTEQQVRCDIEGSCSYNPGYDIWKHKIFQPFDIKFVVYGVPVVITLNSDLYRQVELTASGEISAYAGFSDVAQGRMGLQWRQSGGISPVASFSNTFELTPPTVEGRGTLTAKVWAIPRVRLILYHFIGPSFDFKPYLSTTVSGGFREEMLGQTNDYCAWSLDCNTGLDMAAGLSIMNPVFGYEMGNYSTPNWNIIDKPLYHSPLRIEYNAARGGTRTGQRNAVNFTVYDRNHLFNMDVATPLPQIVKFEGDGDISSEYGIANGGQVSVDWTPLSDQDVLYARLYGIEGNVISEAELHAELNITTSPVTNIAKTTATGGGEIEANEYMTVEERGLCWNTAGAPTLADSHANSGTGTGSYTVSMTGLTPNTTYHVRAYAYLGGEWYYGNEVTFTTQEDEPTPGNWVDLGLPSGLLWATRNVGASSPEDYGDYFAWGETSPKSYYDWDTYAYGYYDDNWSLHLTKYNTDSYYGPVDNLITLQPGDDAATAHYGGRMPTREEWQELYNHCTSTWTTLNGVNGRCFTGPNGNSVFLPAAGYRWYDEVYYAGSIIGFYWSSSLYTSYPLDAWYFIFDSGYMFGNDRYYGLSVRAVREN